MINNNYDDDDDGDDGDDDFGYCETEIENIFDEQHSSHMPLLYSFSCRTTNRLNGIS